MKRIVGIVCVFAILLILCGTSLSATDNKPHKAHDGQIACLTFSDMELIGKLAQQNDAQAFEKMLKNGRCMAFKGGEIIYKIDELDLYTRVRIKGGTMTFWTVMK
jgi:hypothetical protein